MGTLPEDKSLVIGFRVVLGEMPTTRPLPKLGPAAYQENVKQQTAEAVSKGYISGDQARNGVIHLVTSANHYAFDFEMARNADPEHKVSPGKKQRWKKHMVPGVMVQDC